MSTRKSYSGRDKQKSETKWLCDNAKSLEKFSGEWVMFDSKSGVLSKGRSLRRVIKSTGKGKIPAKSYVFHVPSKDELLESF